MRNSNHTSYFTSKNEDFLLHQTSKNEDFIHKHDDFSCTMGIWWECWPSNSLPWKIGTWKHQVTHLRMALEKMIKWMDQHLFQYHNFWGWTYTCRQKGRRTKKQRSHSHRNFAAKDQLPPWPKRLRNFSELDHPATGHKSARNILMSEGQNPTKSPDHYRIYRCLMVFFLGHLNINISVLLLVVTALKTCPQSK